MSDFERFHGLLDSELSDERITGVKDDVGKLDWFLLPLSALREVVRVLMFGADKYADSNWKFVDRPNRRYFSAALRHLNAWQDGERVDAESGLSHLAHACACLIFLLWFEVVGNE